MKKIICLLLTFVILLPAVSCAADYAAVDCMAFKDSSAICTTSGDSAEIHISSCDSAAICAASGDSAVIDAVVGLDAVTFGKSSCIVRFRENCAPAELQDLTPICPEINLYCSDDVSTLNADDVLYIEENAIITAPGQSMDSPEDLSGSQTQLEILGIPGLWQLGLNGEGVRIAVIDSGCAEHSDLNANVLPGKNYVDGSDDVTDDAGHGTHVSGIIAALDNGTGITGVAPDAKIVPLKCYQKTEMGFTFATIDAICRAVRDAVTEFDCQVINMSIGTGTDYQCLRDVCDFAASAGAICIAAAGNKGTADYYYPASYDSVIGVGAVENDLSHADFSQENDSVFVVAPARDVLGPARGNHYQRLSGTSQAVPFLSGIAALLLQYDPSMDGDRFAALLRETSRDLGPDGRDDSFGYGLIDCTAIKNWLVSDFLDKNGYRKAFADRLASVLSMYPDRTVAEHLRLLLPDR